MKHQKYFKKLMLLLQILIYFYILQCLLRKINKYNKHLINQIKIKPHLIASFLLLLLLL
jgi:hypothetical protein